MRLSSRQKFIAAASNPTYKGFASREEVKEAKMLARGHYWDEREFEQFCAYSPSGKREFFEYVWFSWGTKAQHKRWKNEARLVARLWTKGRYGECQRMVDLSCNNSKNR